LAAGIALFSVSDITSLQGRGEIGTLVTSRLLRHYGRIVRDLDRVQLGYDLTKQLNRATEDHPEPAYFELLDQALQSLDDADINLDLIRLWFEAQLLRLAGHTPNLNTDTADDKLQVAQAYNFDFDAMAFSPHANGKFRADHIKLLRLVFGGAHPKQISNIKKVETLLQVNQKLLNSLLQLQ